MLYIDDNKIEREILLHLNKLLNEVRFPDAQVYVTATVNYDTYHFLVPTVATLSEPDLPESKDS